MHLLFVLLDFTIVFCFAWDDDVASFCNSPFFVLPRVQVQAVDGTGLEKQRRRPRPAAETGRSCWGRVLIFQGPAKGLKKNQQT